MTERIPCSEFAKESEVFEGKDSFLTSVDVNWGHGKVSHFLGITKASPSVLTNIYVPFPAEDKVEELTGINRTIARSNLEAFKKMGHMDVGIYSKHSLARILNLSFPKDLKILGKPVIEVVEEPDFIRITHLFTELDKQWIDIKSPVCLYRDPSRSPNPCVGLPVRACNMFEKINHYSNGWGRINTWFTSLPSV